MGVLPDTYLRELIRAGAIRAEWAPTPDQVQPASLDLRLSDKAYRIRASFLPGMQRTVLDMLQSPGLIMHELNLAETGTVLETGCVYLVPLQEALDLPDNLCGRANPKSSTGRIDVFTRLITDRAHVFEDIPNGYSGPLYLEIYPRTFSILARPGDRLAQLRLRETGRQPLTEKTVSIDLHAAKGRPVGWRARRHASVIDLRKLGQHEISEYWEPVYASNGQIVLNPEEFYILASQENISIKAHQAAEMAPIAPELGEFRAHYAGFFDPGFGLNAGGSRAVLEVRSRDVPFILEHGQAIAKLIYEPMLSEPEKVYGAQGSHYQGQGLKLSKHFSEKINS